MDKLETIQEWKRLKKKVFELIPKVTLPVIQGPVRKDTWRR